MGWRQFAGSQTTSRKAWLAVEVAPHTNARRYFKRVFPREGPSDKHLPPARQGFFLKRTEGWAIRTRARPTASTPASLPETRSAPAQQAWHGPEVPRGRPPPAAFTITTARKRKAPPRAQAAGRGSRGGRRVGNARKRGGAGRRPSRPRHPLPPPDSRRRGPLRTPRAPYLCVELGRGHGARGTDAPRQCGGRTSPAGRPRRLGSAQAAARGAGQGRAGPGGRGASGAGGSREPRHHSRARREQPRAPCVPGVLGVAAAARSPAGDAAAAAALCIVGTGGGCARARLPRSLRALAGSRRLPPAAGSEHHCPATPPAPRTPPTPSQP